MIDKEEASFRPSLFLAGLRAAATV